MDRLVVDLIVLESETFFHKQKFKKMKKIILLFVGLGLTTILFGQKPIILAKAQGQDCNTCYSQGPGWTCESKILNVGFTCEGNKCQKTVRYIVCIPPSGSLQTKKEIDWNVVTDSLRREFEKQPFATKGIRDTIIVVVNMECCPQQSMSAPSINFPEQKIVSPQDSGWRIPRISVFGEGTTLRFQNAPPTGGLNPFFGLEFSLTGYRAKTKDKTNSMIKSGLEPQIGLRLSVGKTDQDYSTSCDTCWSWAPNEKSFGFRGELFAQMRWVAPTPTLAQPANQLYWYLGPRLVAFERQNGITQIPGLEGLMIKGGVGFKFAKFVNLELSSFYSAHQRFGFAAELKLDLATFL